MMELNYNEFVSLIFNKKKLPCTYSLDVVDNERYYHLHSAEVMAATSYYCQINSVDDYDETINFESNYKDLCNKPIIIPGMTPDIQTMMLDYFDGILTELKLLNKRIEVGIESGIGHDDVSYD